MVTIITITIACTKNSESTTTPKAQVNLVVNKQSTPEHAAFNNRIMLLISPAYIATLKTPGDNAKWAKELDSLQAVCNTHLKSGTIQPDNMQGEQYCYLLICKVCHNVCWSHCVSDPPVPQCDLCLSWSVDVYPCHGEAYLDCFMGHNQPCNVVLEQ
jgi:hypothetical protein